MVIQVYTIMVTLGGIATPGGISTLDGATIPDGIPILGGVMIPDGISKRDGVVDLIAFSIPCSTVIIIAITEIFSRAQEKRRKSLTLP